ncbi:MAG: T9SS type A sorting domain-containing protein [Bacteroidetes bacterium]|nr:MAG: T9SS type A sorting domain-containing protein [Bacteroidota bacterium]
MKHWLLFSLLIVLTSTLYSQKRILVSNYGDVVPLSKGESAAAAAAKRAGLAASSVACSNIGYFGFDSAHYPVTQGNYGLHQDVMASWFTVPAAGVLDSIFWYMGTNVCAKDSLLYVRVFESNIYEGHGPGYDGYPNPSPTTCWGYFNNTNDIDNGIAAFPEDATDPNWISTVENAPATSWVPFGNELWGAGGFPAKVHGGRVNFIDAEELPAIPTFAIGDHILITFKINGNHSEPCSGPSGNYTLFNAYGEIPDSLTHNWKFYEHQPDFIEGFPCKGWVSRGDFHLIIWYSMVVTTNLPPNINSVTSLEHTISTNPRTVTADIEDCDPGAPDSAGVDYAIIEYSVDGVQQPPITMINLGGSVFEGDIPGFPGGSTVEYNIRAYDLKGMENFTIPSSYNVVAAKTNLALLKVNEDCSIITPSANRSAISPSEFFLPPKSTSTSPKDDGTAGPFDLGFDFFLGNGLYRFAWVGVNGAISLSKTSDDTVDVNADGFYTANWTFPNNIRRGRNDTDNATAMPRTFISPFWNDLIVGDTLTQYGNIYVQDDPDQFIVEWDSLGKFTTTSIEQDQMKFRIVLNKSDNTIEFQYDDIGITDLDLSAFVGMQSDSTDATDISSIFVNQNGAPPEYKPVNTLCFKFYNAISFSINDKWNLVSLPVEPVDSDYSVATNFPTANSLVFRYDGSYQSTDPVSMGPGYWIKFVNAQIVANQGTPKTSLALPLSDDWNLIGSLSLPFPVSNITDTIVSGSSFFEYNNGYLVATTIYPGKGYWVKASEAGTLNLDATATASKRVPVEMELSPLQSITISDASGGRQKLYIGNTNSLQAPLTKFELPPAPPHGLFDARFASQRFVEVYPSDFDGEKYLEYSINIQSDAYPLTVKWNSPRHDDVTFIISDAQQGKLIGETMLNGIGSLQIKNPGVNKLIVKVIHGSTSPREYALSQNYPNPFNPSTQFKMEIPQLTDIDVSVFDVLGRKIATIANGTKQSGFYTVEWNGVDDNGFSVPTGVYIVRMNAGEFSETRKILLMK